MKSFERELLRFVDELDTGETWSREITQGIFDSLGIFKKDFLSINGHDPLYVPTIKEDSDIFNRFVLNGYELIQTWKGFSLSHGVVVVDLDGVEIMMVKSL